MVLWNGMNIKKILENTNQLKYTPITSKPKKKLCMCFIKDEEKGKKGKKEKKSLKHPLNLSMTTKWFFIKTFSRKKVRKVSLKCILFFLHSHFTPSFFLTFFSLHSNLETYQKHSSKRVERTNKKNIWFSILMWQRLNSCASLCCT